MDAPLRSTAPDIDERIERARERVAALRALEQADGAAVPGARVYAVYREPDPGAMRERVLEELHDEAARLAIALAIRASARRARQGDRWFGVARLGRRSALVLAAAPLLGLVFAATRNLGLLIVSSGFAVGGAAMVGMMNTIPPRRF